MKKFLKILGVLVAAGILLLLVAGFVMHKSLPEGESGPAADALAKKMLTALNEEAYRNTRFLEWSFRDGGYQYKWDRWQSKVDISWKDYAVKLNLKNPEKSLVMQQNEVLTGKAAEQLVAKALKSFHNDSFWLVAPYKVFDSGTKRTLVTMEDGQEGLLVTYMQGGTTPGDSYLWLLDDKGFPKAYQMWVEIIPIGGLEASWDAWMTTKSGAFLPTTHRLGPMTIDMGTVRGY
ncbi:MAG: hypothetical protein AAFQ20_08950 [Bacteroidota bacterium]